MRNIQKVLSESDYTLAAYAAASLHGNNLHWVAAITCNNRVVHHYEGGLVYMKTGATLNDALQDLDTFIGVLRNG